MLPLRMGALQNQPNRQGSSLIFGTYLLEPPAFAPQAQPLPAPPCGDQSQVVQYDRGRQVAP